ncbi:MAG: sulfide:quinone oxidoreductase [Solirubrobacteraceae bacterium]|nr:sulfide:quinone oxidoreductase [Solirubrobacteraceae bacterium]
MTGEPARVLVVGGGVGGLEAALALRALGRRHLRVELLSAEPQFTYRAWSVGTPFGHGAAVEVDLGHVAADVGFTLLEGRLEQVDAERHEVRTQEGVLAYDHLLLALGAKPVSIVDGAFTFLGPANAAELGALLAEDRLPAGARVVFVTSPSAVWPLPAYELALLTADRGGPAVMLVTGERTPLECFGRQASAEVAALLRDRGVEIFTSTVPASFDGEQLLVPMAGSLPADVVVALPGLVGHPIAGIPHDASGFVPVDEFCRVQGLDDVFAVGDMTARPLKQGGLAAQQADVAAAVVASDAGSPVGVEAYAPVLRAILLTGREPRYLRHPPLPELRPQSPDEAPWWPPDKIVGRHLAPYLATHGELVVTPAHA